MTVAHTLNAQFELTGEERHFVADALRRAHACADGPMPVAQLLGVRGGTEFDQLIDRLFDAVQADASLSADDWGRTLILAETAWSDVEDQQAKSAAESVLEAIHHRFFDARQAALSVW